MSIMWKKVEGVPFSHCDGIWGGSVGVALCIFHLGMRWEGVLNFMPWPL